MTDEVKYGLPPQKATRAAHRWLMSLVVLVIGGVIGFSVRPMAGNSSVSESLPEPTAPAVLLSRDIVKKIEDSLTFPGQIKVTVIRETRAVEYANK